MKREREETTAMAATADAPDVGDETIRAAAQGAASVTPKKAKTQPELREEFSSARIDANARDSAVCISVSMDVEKLFRGARVIPLTSDGASWIYYVPKWYRRIYAQCMEDLQITLPYADWFQQVWNLHPKDHDTIKMFGRDVLTPRYQQVYGTSYRFSGKMFHAKEFPEQLIHAVTLMQALVVHADSGETYLQGALVNWYEHGDHYVGPHSDDESHLHLNSPVFALTLGATRRFIFTPRANTPDQSAKKLELSLDDGDLLVMGGTTQKTHKHALPKMKKCAGKRISLTMRCFK
ncbi:hypothetical protein Poli38472_008656 [Pythium oligandrum]|uniref:Fe2OG dioxygenase domain-containing protein n=1 Tax=Pythium oligandrum TaxID=41045 RepID=A0A8K1FEM9_PYTOL|nr:hypothetical protein Poli38472_008656 [Pythium oligandrum]|eukprot:TMW56008.1 hypothetical protein Poli38472_008656 [Pythium oligandrum]